jgi:hypothetical protein
MPLVSKGWHATSAFFKAEKAAGLAPQINIGLGRGAALDIFNKNIVEAAVCH